MPEPKIFTRSYVDSECDITVSSGSANKHKLYDRDNASQWITSGENSDATESSIEVAFKQAGATVSREIDRIILVNHNLEDPIAEYWDGDSWEAFDSETDLTDGTCTVFTHAAVETERIRIRNSQTITANAEKAVGELIACAVQFESADNEDLSSYDVTHQQRMAVDLPLIDGGVHRAVVRHSANRSDKYEAKPQFQLLSLAQLEVLKTIKASGLAFLWQPESDYRPAEIYLVNWVGALQYKYASTYKGAGFQLTMDLKEA